MKAATLLPRVRAMLADRPAELVSDADLLRAFVASKDERAFATLVRRHGPLVLATARRIVGNPADADDVFQATFLLLARNAATIRNRNAVAGWLHGVASRMARTARRTAARRRTYEARVPGPAASKHNDLSWREVQVLFEDELARLPDCYRVPFVLCALNGEPRAEVARQIGVKEGTISSRLAEAKRRLQEALSARGVSLAVVLGAVTLPGLAVSRQLIDRTVHSAATGSAPAAVAALLRGSIMTARKMLVSIALALSAGIFLAAVGAAPPSEKANPPKDAPPRSPEKTDVRGKLLDADGKPLAKVPVRLWSYRNGDKLPEPATTTDAAGAFQLKPNQLDIGDNALVLFSPAGLPAEWVPLSRFKGDLTVKLPKDDVPFTGRVVTLENQPINDVTIEVVRVGTAADGTISEWVDKNVALRKDHFWMNEEGLIMLSGNLVLSTARTTTDSDGKFKLTGFGRDRILRIKVHGPNLESKHFWVAARPGGPADGYIKTPDFNHGLYPPDITVRLAPSRPLVGTITDSKTGKPVSGVVVSEVNTVTAKSITDKDGHYRLEGIPKKKQYGVTVTGRKGVPYFDYTHLWTPDAAGLDPLETNLAINRGLELTGRVVDKAGRPVRAHVFYHPNGKNPNVKDTSQGLLTSDGGRTAPDGSFYLTVWPGRGAVEVRANEPDKYASVDVEKVLTAEEIRSRPIGRVHGIVAVDFDEARPETLTLTFTLGEGVTRKGTVVDADGKPVDGVIAAGVRGRNDRPDRMESNAFEVAGMRTDSHRFMLFRHESKKLGAVQSVSGDSEAEVQVKLLPLGRLTGEVRKADKDTWTSLTVTAMPLVRDGKKYDNLPSESSKIQGLYNIQSSPWWKLTKKIAKTDEKGHFTLEGLLPGLEYSIYLSDGDLGEPGTLVASKSRVTVEPGKTTELGTLTKAKGQD